MKKEIYINHPDLDDNILILRLSFWGSSKLYLNNNPVAKKKGIYSLSERLDKPFIITLKNNFFDPIPKVIVNRQTMHLEKPLKWYQYIWMGLPILLIFQGGALGGFLGAVAFRTNGSIFRSDRSTLEKYLFAMGLNITVCVLFFTLAYYFQVALHGN